VNVSEVGPLRGSRWGIGRPGAPFNGALPKMHEHALHFRTALDDGGTNAKFPSAEHLQASMGAHCITTATMIYCFLFFVTRVTPGGMAHMYPRLAKATPVALGDMLCRSHHRKLHGERDRPRSGRRRAGTAAELNPGAEPPESRSTR